ncbi:MAG TPA: ATP-binding cassette domain-containing protein [Solirubrobacteraceae bacterium]
MSSSRVVLRLTDVVKTFPGVIALKGVGFEVTEGEVHALVGENGAGKSTLISVAAGSTLPDSGTVEIGGEPMTQPSPAAAQALGLAVVYQQRAILEDLTVAENMVFAMPGATAPRVSSAGPWVRDKLAAIGATTIDPAARISELSVADRQLLDIAKALALDPKVLVLDEPTESLTPADSDRLFEQIAAITQAGTAVVYISHRLPEVQRIADRITVLRDGEARGTMAAAGVSEDQILRLIIGRSVDQAFPDKPAIDEDQPPLLEIEALSGPRFDDVALSIRPGEIVGLAGVEGNGQAEFLRALAGLVPSRGTAILRGQPVSLGDPAGARKAGLVYMPGDRHAEGLFDGLSVRDNVSPLVLDRIASGGIVRRARESRVAAAEIERMAIKTPSPETDVSTLSGGNQQKVVFARALLAEPAVLLADEPTRGVDVGARLEIYQVLRGVAASGQAVVVLSSDVIELQGLCDRVHVFSRGAIVRELAGDDITEESITGAAITSAAAGGRVGLAAGADRARRAMRARRFVAGDYLPSVVLAALILGLGIYTSASNGRFLTALNFQGMLLLASALALISFGQLIVLLTGGIDLSVGPLSGLTVVVFSFFAADGQGAGRLLLGLLAVIGVAMAVGLANGVQVRVFRIAAVLATLATYIVLQGISLALRPEPAGYLRASVTDALTHSWGWIPIAFVVVCILAVMAELVLRFTRPGLQIRAVGSDEPAAHRLGARVNRTHILAYVLCSLFTAAGGLMLASQVGVGDATVGVTYTLTSITAVVLGGASIFGGRGSFIGALLGAVLLQQIVTSTTFLHIGVAWESFLFGGLILVGAGTYSRARRARSGRLGAEVTA